jgi:hypothetical protein
MPDAGLVMLRRRFLRSGVPAGPATRPAPDDEETA